MAMGRSSRGEDARGQSNPVALVLIFGLVVAATTVVLVAGGLAITDAQDQLNAQSAEKAMTQLDSQASLVALGQSESQVVEFGSRSGGGDYRVKRQGQMTIRVTGESDPILQETLGSVVYEADSGTKIAYQGGGVWRSDGDGNSVMVSPPELQYRNKTLTLPLVTVDGDNSLDGGALITQNSSTRVFPTDSEDRTNPITEGRIEITIQSEYYRAWADYLRSRTSGGVEVDSSNNEVTLTLLQQEKRTVEQAMNIGGERGRGELVIQSGNKIVVDNYDSATVSDDQGPNNPPSSGGSADVQTTMDIKFNGNALIEGDLTTGGTVTGFSGRGRGQSGVDGNLRYGTGSVSDSDCDQYVTGWCNDNASIEQPEKIDNEIDSTLSGIKSDHDNSETDCLSEGDALRYGDGPCGSDSITLENGDYYIDNNDFRVDSDQKLILDTRDGDINIALDNGRQIDIDGNVTVIGDGRVNVYATSQVNIDSDSSKIWNRGWDADQFWVYCDAGCQIAIRKGIFNGVIYSPAGSGGSDGEISIRNGARVYGAITAGGENTARLDSNSEVHFDENLRSTEVFRRATVPSISYLHVSVNRINVTDS